MPVYFALGLLASLLTLGLAAYAGHIAISATTRERRADAFLVLKLVSGRLALLVGGCGLALELHQIGIL